MNVHTLRALKFLVTGSVLLSAYAYVGNEDSSIVVNNQIHPVTAASLNMGMNNPSAENIKINVSSALSSLPASLEGVDTNIQLSIDSAGMLIVNQALRDMFEVYLSANGEESLEIIILRIQQNLSEQLKNPALDQALALLDNYIAYRQALVELEAYINEKSSLLSQIELFEVRQGKIKSLRDQYFDEATYQGFFAEEDQYDQFLFSQLTISQNTELTEQEKQQQIHALESTLPEEVVEVRKSATQYGELHYEVAALQKNGASPEQIYQARSQQLGDEAATALAALDEKRKDWNAQLDEFKQYKQSIIESTLSPEDQQLSLQAWLDERFTEIEQLRVKAITASL